MKRGNRSPAPKETPPSEWRYGRGLSLRWSPRRSPAARLAPSIAAPAYMELTAPLAAGFFASRSASRNLNNWPVISRRFARGRLRRRSEINPFDSPCTTPGRPISANFILICSARSSRLPRQALMAPSTSAMPICSMPMAQSRSVRRASDRRNGPSGRKLWDAPDFAVPAIPQIWGLDQNVDVPVVRVRLAGWGGCGPMAANPWAPAADSPRH
jgi:hypothetical protein